MAIQLWAALAAALLSPARAQVRNPDTFMLAEVGEVTSLDPAFPYDNSSQGAIYNLYDTLIGFDGSSLSKLSPRIAVQVPTVENGGISADGLVYRFTIRPDVRFHDGSLVTPQDVRYSLLRFMLTDRAGGPSALLLQPIAGVSSTRDASGKVTLDYDALARRIVAEGQDVVIRLPRPFAPFLSIMARWSYVVSENWAKAHGEWDGQPSTWKRFNNPQAGASYFDSHEDGAGPFQLERWDRIGKAVVLKRFDGYYRGKAKLARAVIKCVPEFSTRRLMLQAGDADMIEAPRPLISQLEGLPGVRLQDGLMLLATDPALFFTFKINAFANRDIGSGKLDGQGIPPDFFADPDVRKGFAYAFDYDAFIKDTFKGAATRAKEPTPPGVPGYASGAPYYTFDLDKAKEHFQKAFNTHVWEKGFRFTLTYNVGSENRQAACQIIKRNVESLNPRFHVDLRGVDWASFLAKQQARQMPMFAIGWFADYPDAHNFVYNFFDSRGRYPSAQGYSSTEMDQWIDKAVREVDRKKREADYDHIAKLGYAEVPAIFTVHPVSVYPMRTWVHGFDYNPVYLDVQFYPLSKE